MNQEKLEEIIINNTLAEKIDPSSLRLERLKGFFEEHGDHGSYDLVLSFDSKGLASIYIHCTAFDLVDTAQCSHQNPDTPADHKDLEIYLRPSPNTK